MTKHEWACELFSQDIAPFIFLQREPPPPIAAHRDHGPCRSGAIILPRRGNRFSLSPGERVGVRAGSSGTNFAVEVHCEFFRRSELGIRHSW
jgi:hypothetical protein